MLMDIAPLRTEASGAVAAAADTAILEALRVKYLGRKGELNKYFDALKAMSVEEKRRHGPELQKFKQELEQAIETRFRALQDAVADSTSRVDVTMPGTKIAVGHPHPLTLVENRIREIFTALHFSAVEGPEVESEYYNFDALNIPAHHPARDMWDTFWLKGDLKLAREAAATRGAKMPHRLLLRTHTSPVQIRYMETHQPPFQVIVPGRVFRFEATDASHEINFTQVEGLMVGKDVNLANFKFIIKEFFRRLFSKEVKLRFRPSYFPFVEPGLEVDVECVRCGGKGLIPQSGTADSANRDAGCGLCKETGWLEVMGAGMVHPHVFEAAGYNPRELQGFAFGLGLERIAMIKYNIPDIRLFYSGDLRFIKQF